MARKRNVRYTAEEAERTIMTLLALMGHVIDNCEDREMMGAVFSYARYAGGAQGGGAGVSAAADSLAVRFGGESMGTVALAAFNGRHRDMAEAARMINTVNVAEAFGLKGRDYGK